MVEDSRDPVVFADVEIPGIAGCVTTGFGRILNRNQISRTGAYRQFLHSYNANELSSQPDDVKNEVQPSFVNDNYWFLLPFRVYWDTSATVSDKGMHKLPIGTGREGTCALRA